VRKPLITGLTDKRQDFGNKAAEIIGDLPILPELPVEPCPTIVQATAERCIDPLLVRLIVNGWVHTGQLSNAKCKGKR